MCKSWTKNSQPFEEKCQKISGRGIFFSHTVQCINAVSIVKIGFHLVSGFIHSLMLNWCDVSCESNGTQSNWSNLWSDWLPLDTLVGLSQCNRHLSSTSTDSHNYPTSKTSKRDKNAMKSGVTHTVVLIPWQKVNNWNNSEATTSVATNGLER